MPAQNLPFLPPSPFQWRPNRETETAHSRVSPHFPHRSAAAGAIMASWFLFSLPSPLESIHDDSRKGYSVPTTKCIALGDMVLVFFFVFALTGRVE